MEKEELKGCFIGYKSFRSTKSNKTFYVISVLFLTDEENRVTYFVKDIFTNEKTYNDFLNQHSIMDFVDLAREIVGDTVRYYI